MREPTNQSLSKERVYPQRMQSSKGELTTAKECIYHQETATWKERCSNDQRLLPFFCQKVKSSIYSRDYTSHNLTCA
jgi:hypothetical protein